MGVTEGVLALLDAGPKHGYGLKLAFEDATAGAWRVNVGQVYSSLQRLEQHGFVVGDGEDDGRKRYRLTDAGRERAVRWFVAEPIGPQGTSRDELVMKVLLALRTSLADALQVVATQRDATVAAMQQLTQRKASLGADPPLAELLHLDRMILQARAELDWLDLAEARLDDTNRTGDEK